MARKKQETDRRRVLPLPEKDSPDYFRALVRNCVAEYGRLLNDRMVLDYCKVGDKRLRAMILEDEEYKVETRSIYARQWLEEMEEVNSIARLAENMGGVEKGGEGDEADGDDYEFVHPSEHGRKGRKATVADKDMLNTRFRAVQMRREMLASAVSMGGNESEAVVVMYVPFSGDEYRRAVEVEIHQGSLDADMDELAGRKEKAAEGTAGSVRGRPAAHGADEFFTVDAETGEVREKG